MWLNHGGRYERLAAHAKLAGNPDLKRSLLGTHLHGGGGGNIDKGIKQNVFADVQRIKLDQDINYWQTLVSTLYTFWFHKRRKIAWLNEPLAASQEGYSYVISAFIHVTKALEKQLSWCEACNYWLACCSYKRTPESSTNQFLMLVEKRRVEPSC
jgi:hypothetical protein